MKIPGRDNAVLLWYGRSNIKVCIQYCMQRYINACLKTVEEEQVISHKSQVTSHNPTGQTELITICLRLDAYGFVLLVARRDREERE